MSQSKQMYTRVMQDPTASYLLKKTIESFDNMDPVDALHSINYLKKWIDAKVFYLEFKHKEGKKK